MSMLIDPLKWPKFTGSIALTAGVHWCVRKENQDTFAINLSKGTQLDQDRFDYYGPVKFMPPRFIPPKPELKPVLIELLKDCSAGREGDLIWVVRSPSGSFCQLVGSTIQGYEIGKSICRVVE